MPAPPKLDAVMIMCCSKRRYLNRAHQPEIIIPQTTMKMVIFHLKLQSILNMEHIVKVILSHETDRDVS